MTKIAKKITTVFLLLVAIFSLSACDEIVGKGGSDTMYIGSSWEKVGMKNHINGGADCGPLNYLAVENLIQYVRSTDELYYVLAKKVVHNDDGTSMIYLRDESKWQNGDDFVAEDVIAYYYINQLETSNYMQAIEKVDNKTVKITWREAIEPNDSVKNLLLAIDPVGSVQYKEFKVYVDRIIEIMNGAEDAPEGYTGWAPFGKLLNNEESTQSYDNYAKFNSHNPNWFVATGVFKVQTMTETDMILVKDETHWMANYIPYTYVHAYNGIGDATQVYGMLGNGTLSTGGGSPAQAIIEQVLASNEDLVHFNWNDPGACGLLFNQAKTVTVNGVEEKLFTKEVREAFQYIFDRDAIAYIANPHATTTYRSMLAMCPSEAKTYMSAEAWNSLKVYEYNKQKAEQMLIAAGWSKKDGAWYSKDGEKCNFTLHYDSGNEHQANAAQACAAQLNEFGIATKLKASSSWADWFGTAQSTVWSAELSLNWTDLNMSIGYPTGSFVYAFKDVTHKVIHLDTFPAKGEEGWEELEDKYIGAISVELPKFHGEGTYLLCDYIQGLYSLSDEELVERVDDIVTGVASECWGVPFYQNACSTFFNKSTFNFSQSLLDLIDDAGTRNVPGVPEAGTDAAYELGRLSIAFSKICAYVDWDAYYQDHPEEKLRNR